MTLPAFQMLGLDVRAALPRGRKSDSCLYLALREPIDQVVAALRDAGLPEADYSVADIFLWRLHSGKALTPQQLAEILRVGERMTQTLAQTRLFLEQITTLLQERMGEVEARVGMQVKSKEPEWNVQYLDTASFTPSRDLLPAKTSGKAHPLNLSVYLLPDQLWWGVYARASQEAIGNLRDAFERLGLIEPDELATVDTGGIGVSKKVWPGGAYFALGHGMTADEVAAQHDLTMLAATIADDLAEYYERITPHLGSLRRIISGQAVEVSNVWIFQANPRIYDLETGLRRERLTDWQITRYRDEIRSGDQVLFWKAGEKRGVYGFGTVVSQPYERPDGDWMVDVQYEGRLRKPVLYETPDEHPVLSKMLIMRQHQGTNFRVTPQEWVALEPLLGEIIPPDPDGIDARQIAELKERSCPLFCVTH